MGERTSHEPGTFSWADLATSDLQGAKGFYSGLLGWEFEDMPAGEGMTYSMARLRGKYVAAAYEGDPQQGPPHWNAYVTVASVDEMPDRVTAAGGTVVMPPFDVLDVGRMTVLQDPTGAFLSLWQATGHIGAERVTEPGALTWNELATDDDEKAKAFYSELFGWTYQPGPQGYSMVMNGERMNGGIRRKSDAESGVPANWSVCFGCDSAEETFAAAQAAGARPLFGPMEAGPGVYAFIADPHGAVFSVYSGRFDD